ncbi:MAG: chitobiase/beta-hexosaminidase C-terminal domain-containing protein [Balneolales bacterium]|nr:chitobiase/beta-hexosaminidase C-terminal domain-containing protein [Balneolales bacterium]
MNHIYNLLRSGIAQLSLILLLIPVFAHGQVSISPEEGVYQETISVTMSTSADGAEIRYTTDGRIPTMNSPLYTDPINIRTNTLLIAIAFVDAEPTISNPTVKKFTFPTRIRQWGDPFPTYFDNGSVVDNIMQLVPDQYALLTDGDFLELESGERFSGYSFNEFTNPVFVGSTTRESFNTFFAIAQNVTSFEFGYIHDGLYDGNIDPEISGTGVKLGSAGGFNHGVYLIRDGRVQTWGNLGQSDRIVDDAFYVAVAAASDRTLSLRDDGTVRVWRFNTDLYVPEDLSGVIGIAASDDHNVAIRENGSVVVWDENGLVDIPQFIDISNAVKADARHETIAILTEDGRIVADGPEEYKLNQVPQPITRYSDVIVFGNTIFGFEPLLRPDWNFYISATDVTMDRIEVILGFSEFAEVDTYVRGLDKLAPPASPEGNFDFRITESDEDYFMKYRKSDEGLTVWDLQVRSAGDADDIVKLSWAEGFLDDLAGRMFIEYILDGETQMIDMETVNGVDVKSGTVRITFATEVPVYLDYSEGWELVGLPYPSMEIPATVFPAADPSTFYQFERVYEEARYFEEGRGFWLNFTQPYNDMISGPFPNIISVNVYDGWNLISGTSFPVHFDDIEDTDNLLVEGTLTGFDDGYFSTDTMYGGYGYWVMSEGHGTLTLNNVLQLETTLERTRPYVRPEGLVPLSVRSDESRPIKFLTGDPVESFEDLEINPLRYSMPPRPPNGVFDVRFEDSSSYASGEIGYLELRHPGETLTFNFDENGDYPEARMVLCVFRGEDSETEEEYTMNSGDELSIDGLNVTAIETRLSTPTSIRETEDQLPAEVALAQNFPNPFNPTTRISYDLPSESAVRLAVYDLLGRQVAVLVNERMSAGSHFVTFDAASLSSGVYMYRLEASGVVLTQKMTLVK